MDDKFKVREIQPADSLEELTDLLHRAYKALADMGLRFYATHQDVEVTRQRVARGVCLVVECEGRLVGTVSVFKAAANSKCEWYLRPDVMVIGQLAVDPIHQSAGLGGELMRRVEETAKSKGATEVALDTAEGATHLINWYTKLGYRFVQHVSWEVVNYRSVVLSKTLSKG